MVKSNAPDGNAWLARQSLGRALTPEEIALAEALEAIFASGTHDFAEVCKELSARNIALPSQAPGPWTVDVLERELARINSSLDDAYQAGGRP